MKVTLRRKLSYGRGQNQESCKKWSQCLDQVVPETSSYMNQQIPFVLHIILSWGPFIFATKNIELVCQALCLRFKYEQVLMESRAVTVSPL